MTSRGNKQPDSVTGLPWDTIPTMLDEALSVRPNSLALIDGDVEFCYGALAKQVKALSSNLQRFDIAAGDAVVIWSNNCWQCVVSILACWFAGAVVVPVSSRLKALEVLPVLRATRSKLLLTSTSCNRVNLPAMLADYCHDSGRGVCEELPHLAAIGAFEDCDERDLGVPLFSWPSLMAGFDRSDAGLVEVGPDDLCEIMFTSGSTGKPKGVMLAQRQTLRIMWDAGNIWTIDRNDRVLIIAPLSHVTGINAGLLAGLMSGAALVLLDHFHARKALERIETHGITCLAGPPAMFKQLLVENARSNSLDSLRKVSILGAPIPASLVDEIQSDTSIEVIFAGYGMTECSSIATTRFADSAQVVMNTVGYPMPGLEIMIASEDGEDLSGEASGEIRVRGYGVMQGYLEDEAQTRAAIADGGWLKTGDIGALTSDGRICLLGRKKEMYIAYGFNVFPAEVEFLLLQSGLVESAAVVARPNRFSGEEGVAFVVLNPSVGDDARSLLKWARQNMANYKVPSKIVAIPEMPLNTNGKIDKITLQRQIEDS